MKKVVNKAIKFIASRSFFIATLIIFVLESLWIAITFGYSGPFDENTHFAIIKLLSGQWAPFFTHQPPHSYQLGALTTNPSLLYHYLLSFPYRIGSHWFHSTMSQVIFLRVIDILLFAVGLVIFRALLLRTKASSSIVNVTLFFFILIPVVPFLAAQINYDDLLMPLVALTLLLTVRFKEKLTEHSFHIGFLVSALSVGMLASLTQYEFLPIYVVMVGYLVYSIWRFVKENPKHKDLLRKELMKNWHSTKIPGRILLILLLAVSLGLFTRTYGVNLVKYRTPVPKCDKVLDINHCLSYSPWARGYLDSLHKGKVDANPVGYSLGWTYRMFDYSFYSSSGGANASEAYINAKPLLILSLTAITVFCGGVILAIRYGKEILKKYPALNFLWAVTIFYVLVLWINDYASYLYSGQKIGINGRYLFPVALIFMLTIGLAYHRWLRSSPISKLVLAVVVFLLFLQGGGTLTYIKDSNPGWYWPDDSLAIRLNKDAQSIISPVILNYRLFSFSPNK